MKRFVIPEVTGDTGVVTKWTKRQLKAIPRKHSMDYFAKQLH
jgi:hypothetical protein